MLNWMLTSSFAIGFEPYCKQRHLRFLDHWHAISYEITSKEGMKKARVDRTK